MTGRLEARVGSVAPAPSDPDVIRARARTERGIRAFLRKKIVSPDLE